MSMTDHVKTAPEEDSELAALTELIRGGGFWRLAPEWWPRTFDTDPSRETLKAIAAGLRRLGA